ncbi:MAG TPA: DUF4019 domain-containing protein [Chthoniobacterales bacterium]|nr:DUF4019 domain-containing protein [Chthoniobacterales bacterium]
MKRGALIGLLIAITVVSDALTLSKDDELARDAAVQWLQLVDAGRFDEAASQGSTEVRSFDQWLNYFAVHRGPLGRANKRKIIEVKHTANLPGLPDVRRYAMIRFKTAFERNPAATEEVVLAKIGCCWEIFGYAISDK